MKIDLVYLWVDGSDEHWLAKKNAELEKVGEKPLAVDVGKHRFNDNDELLFSLRSVEKFAPWVNHIFIVTDKQIPKWLNTNNPKITIVDHTEIMPADALPCFNSSIIEFFVVNIPNLSEHFILANDDTLFMATTKPNYFFTEDGIPIVRISNKRKVRKKLKNLFPVGEQFKKQWERGETYDRTKLNSRKLVYEIIGTHNALWEESHNIDPYIKSDIVKVINMPLVKKQLEQTRKNHFRHHSDLHRSLFHLFGVVKFGYQTVGNDCLTKFKQKAMFCFREQPIYTRNIKKKMMFNFRRKLTCIDDPVDMNIRKSNHDYLMKFFSEKSKFEK